MSHLDVYQNQIVFVRLPLEKWNVHEVEKSHVLLSQNVKSPFYRSIAVTRGVLKSMLLVPLITSRECGEDPQGERRGIIDEGSLPLGRVGILHSVSPISSCLNLKARLGKAACLHNTVNNRSPRFGDDSPSFPSFGPYCSPGGEGSSPMWGEPRWGRWIKRIKIRKAFFECLRHERFLSQDVIV